jgi:hypothetical protein
MQARPSYSTGIVPGHICLAGRDALHGGQLYSPFRSTVCWMDFLFLFQTGLLRNAIITKQFSQVRIDTKFWLILELRSKNDASTA